jgi:hypothetical protein
MSRKFKKRGGRIMKRVDIYEDDNIQDCSQIKPKGIDIVI